MLPRSLIAVLLSAWVLLCAGVAAWAEDGYIDKLRQRASKRVTEAELETYRKVRDILDARYDLEREEMGDDRYPIQRNLEPWQEELPPKKLKAKAKPKLKQRDTEDWKRRNFPSWYDKRSYDEWYRDVGPIIP